MWLEKKEEYLGAGQSHRAATLKTTIAKAKSLATNCVTHACAQGKSVCDKASVFIPVARYLRRASSLADMATSAGQGCCSKARKCLAREPLLLSTILGVVFGVVVGIALRAVEPSSRVVEVVGFPGEVLMRLLKMVVLPLVAGSMVAGVCSLRASTFGMGKVARVTLLYYLLTTVLAVSIGVLAVLSIRPGRNNPFKQKVHTEVKEDLEEKESKADLLNSVMDIIRDLFPSNAVGAASEMNILGIITVSILFGLGLSAQGSEADEFVGLVNVFNGVVEKVHSFCCGHSCPMSVGCFGNFSDKRKYVADIQ